MTSTINGIRGAISAFLGSKWESQAAIVEVSLAEAYEHAKRVNQRTAKEMAACAIWYKSLCDAGVSNDLAKYLAVKDFDGAKNHPKSNCFYAITTREVIEALVNVKKLDNKSSTYISVIDYVGMFEDARTYLLEVGE